ncbi:MAG: glycosyltransferase family 39 protein [Proteobacteria bacterium]|nr:glycosyltransferase family 39 protein [Pseudomonadota bacterium]
MTATIGDQVPPARQLRGVFALLDVAVGSHARAMALLAAIALLAFVPGFFQLPPVDRDEARFAQASKQMLESGDFIDIRFQGETRYKKPVGIYWLQAAVVGAAETVGLPQARTTIWLYRIPSLLGAIGAVVLTYWTALAFVPRRAAVLAALMLAASLLLGVEARLAKTDAMLLASVVAVMGALARVYLGAHGAYGSRFHGWRLAAIFWVALACGILLKGPLILLMAGLTIAALAIVDRSLAWIRILRPLSGLCLVLVITLPWFAAILWRSGPAFLTDSLGRDLLAKVVSGQEAHGAPPGTYLLLFWITFWPAAPLAALAAPAVWRARREIGARFLLAWLVPSWIVFELVVTKLPHYVLPLYPAVAILIAAVMHQNALASSRWMMSLTSSWFIVSSTIALVLIIAPIAIGRHLELLAWPFAGAAAVFGLLAWWLFAADGAVRSLLRATAAALLLWTAAYGIAFPALPTLFPSVLIAERVKQTECPGAQLASAGYGEPSLVFLSGTKTLLTDGPGAADFLRQGGCRFAVISARQLSAFAQRAEATGVRYSLVQRFDGVNFSAGRAVSLSLYRGEPR